MGQSAWLVSSLSTTVPSSTITFDRVDNLCELS